MKTIFFTIFCIAVYFLLQWKPFKGAEQLAYVLYGVGLIALYINRYRSQKARRASNEEARNIDVDSYTKGTQGDIYNASFSSASTKSENTNDSINEELSRLKNQFDSGSITHDEYESRKKMALCNL